MNKSYISKNFLLKKISVYWLFIVALVTLGIGLMSNI